MRLAKAGASRTMVPLTGLLLFTACALFKVSYYEVSPFL